MLLRVENIYTSYGKISVLEDVSLSIGEGEIVALLGRNGVGKSTLFKNVLKLVPFLKGKILINGNDITKIPAYRIPQLGISYMPQANKIFPDLSVRENLQLAFLEGNSSYESILEIEGRFRDLIRVPNSNIIRILKALIQERSNEVAGYLSGGEQQLLCMARGLLANPKMMLMDEPMANLGPNTFKEMQEFLCALKDRGLSIFLIEQRIKWALQVSDRTYVMQKGTILYEGNSKYLLENEGQLLNLLGVTEEPKEFHNIKDRNLSRKEELK